MVSLLQWVLVGIVAYTLAAMALDSRGKLPGSVKVSGPIITIHTQRGKAFLDWLAGPKRFWRAWGNLGLGVALVFMVGSFFIIIQSAIQAIREPVRTPVNNPQNVLVIPGFNDFLPVAATPEIVFGLLVGLVVHEGGHGLLCRVEDIDIESMGIAAFSFIPIGAFVEPSEESRAKASRGAQSRMFAAGVTNNFFVTILCFVLLFGPVAGSIAVASGTPVGSTIQGSAARDAGIEHGQVITSVEGNAVINASDLERTLAETRGRGITVGLQNGSTIEVNRSLLVTRAVPELLDGINLSRDRPTTVQAVNGTAVYTERDLATALAGRPVAEIETDRGTATMPVGAYVTRVNETGPLGNTNAPSGDFVITHIDGQRTANLTALGRVLDGLAPGSTVPVVAYHDGERETYSVELGTDRDGDGGWLGIRVQQGYSGLVVDEFGVDEYPAGQFLQYLGGGGNDGLLSGQFIQQMLVVLILPFFSVIAPGGMYNFAGFLPDVVDFYVVTGPLGFLGSGIFVLANVLFWTGWINLNLGFFNCFPTFPLDGGHLLRASAESFIARLPVDDGRQLTTAVTMSVSLFMIGALLAMLFGPTLLA
jgi:membrane-associated protease RseP (regulator of RpoE activity)